MLVTGLLAGVAAPASATWSIVAVESRTREVGLALASCVGGAEVAAGLAPGHGVIVAQAFTSFRGRDRGVELLRAGAAPTRVVEVVANAEYDRWSLPLYRLRQYGVVALDHDEAADAFTGDWGSDWKGDSQAAGVSVQGNLLYGPEVLAEALGAFQEAAGREAPLAERLLDALEAGAAAGGDRRCSRAQAALSAFVVVARPGDEPSRPWLHLSVDAEWPGIGVLLRQQVSQWWKRRRDGFADAPLAPDESNAVRELRRRYEEWRAEADWQARRPTQESADAQRGAAERRRTPASQASR